jgi:hypothetical protein
MVPRAARTRVLAIGVSADDLVERVFDDADGAGS